MRRPLNHLIPHTKILYFFMLGFFAPAPLVADTLQDALGIAYLTNPTILAARADLRAIDEDISQAYGGWRPLVELGAQSNITQSRSDNASLNQTRKTYSGSLNIRQNIYAGGGTEAGIKQANSAVLAARARLKQKEQQIFLNVATAYMDVLRDQAVLELSQQNVNRLTQQLEATTDRFNVGEVTRTDVAQAESRLASAIAEKTRAQGTLEVSQANYTQFVGKKLENPQQPAFTFMTPTSLDRAIADAMTASPLMQAAREDLTTAQHAVDVAFARLLPNIDLSASASTEHAVTGLDKDTHTLSFLAQVSIPLYQRGIVNSQIRQAKIVVEKSEYVLIETERKVTETVTNSWKNLQTYIAEIDSINKKISAAALALDGVEQESFVGARSVLDVLDAEQELLNAQVTLVRSKRDEIVTRLSLMTAMGKLTVKDLAVEVQPYDDRAYLRKVEKKLWGLSKD